MTAGQGLIPISNVAVRGDAGLRPLHLVHYVPGIRMEQGGVVRAILDWCEVFARRGHRMTLITYQGNDLPAQWLEKGNNPRALVVQPPWLPGKPLGRTAMKTAEAALSDADVLHLHGPWLDGNWQLAKLARRLGVPYIVSTHGMLGDWGMVRRSLKKKIYLRLIGRRVLDGAAAIHCTAEAEWAEASRWFGNPHKAILPYLVDLSPFKNLPGPQAGMELLPAELRNQPKIVFLGRLHEQKGVDLLIRAAALWRDEGTSFVLMLAGAGEPMYTQYLRELVAELKLGDRVQFPGLVTGEKKISLYQAADIFVLPTRHENFGLVLIEALASGTPVVTTRGTNIWDQVQSAGGTIADSTPPAIAAAIKSLLQNPRDLPALGERGRAWAFEHFAMEPLARRYEQLYRQAAGRG